MKINLIIIILIVGGLSGGGYYYYQHYYVDTLMLSEIIGYSNNPGINIAVSLADFDTGLTRHDINQLNNNKEYWMARIQEVDAIANSDLKEQASLKLLSDMMEDPVLKKICKGFLKLGSDISLGVIKMIL
jgi:hypothetical protein